MPRALLLCEYPALNGGERSLLAVLPTLQQAGWEFDAWCPGVGPLAAAFSALGVRTIAHVPVSDPRTTLAERRADLKDVLSCAPRYDLVHANSLATGRVSGPVVEAARIPSISHLRDIVGLNKTAIADLNRHRRLLAVSAATRTHHVAQGLAGEKTEVLYNGIDAKTFKATAPSQYLHRELKVFSETKFVAVIGQLILRKGQDAALAAAVAAMERNYDLHVLVVGKRHSEKFETIAFEEKLHDLPEEYADRVHFLGTRMDVPRLLTECSLLLHMARQEPLGRVLLEAAASGLPSACTRRWD